VEEAMGWKYKTRERLTEADSRAFEGSDSGGASRVSQAVNKGRLSSGRVFTETARSQRHGDLSTLSVPAAMEGIA
jgi:hypothetical protein